MQITLEGKISIFLTLLGLAGAGAIMIFPERVWIGWLLIASAAIGLLWLGFHHFGRRFFVVPVAACALIFDAWFYSNQLSTPAFTSIPVLAPRPTPSPTASRSPTPPPPWVSTEEIERERKAGRILLPFTPDELGNMNFASSRNGSNMDAYVGKWVKISASFKQLSKKTLGDKKEYLVAMTFGQIWLTYLMFDPKKWDETLVRFKLDDRLMAICQLYGFGTESGPIFWNCELR
jgi:hypothetical protein